MARFCREPSCLVDSHERCPALTPLPGIGPSRLRLVPRRVIRILLSDCSGSSAGVNTINPHTFYCRISGVQTRKKSEVYGVGQADVGEAQMRQV
jgi:hypothetical protein